MANSTAPAAAGVRDQSLPNDKFLTVAANLLHKGFIDNTRTGAKGIYRDLYDGKVVPLTRVRMEDSTVVQFDVSLDHSEYRGKLTFGAFRTGLGVLIAHIAEAVKKPEELRTFHNEQNPRAVLFGVTALTVENGETSVLALGADPSASQATVQLQLMYLPFDQFVDAQQTGDSGTA